MIKDKRYEEAFEHIGNETKRGLLPSNDTLKLILNLDEPPELLSQLRIKLPLETEWYDLISEEEVKRKSFQIYVLWKESKREQALESIHYDFIFQLNIVTVLVKIRHKSQNNETFSSLESRI